MKWLYILLLTIVGPYSLPPDEVHAEFSREEGSPRRIQATTRIPTSLNHLVEFSESAIYEVIDPYTLDLTVRYFISNNSPTQTVESLSLLDDLGDDLDDFTTFTIVDAPSKVTGPASVTANGSWTGFAGDEDLLSGGANSLGPRESTTISYKVRFLIETIEDSGGLFHLGGTLGGTQGAGEVSGETDLVFAVPLVNCENRLAVWQGVTVRRTTATTSVVAFDWYIANANTPNCVGVNPECGFSGTDFASVVQCTMDAYIVAPSTWEKSDGLGPQIIAISGDLDQDGDLPDVQLAEIWDGNGDPVATLNDLGPGEWVRIQQVIDITHNGDTAWDCRVWAQCHCAECPTQDFTSDEELDSFAAAIPTIAARMSVGEPVVAGDGYAMPCSIWVKNIGSVKLELIQVEAPIEDAFPATSELTSITGLAVSALTVDPAFDGTAAHPFIFDGVASDELTFGTEVLATFMVNFEEGNQTQWEFKCEASGEPDGGGVAVVDTTNCAPVYDGDTDGDPDEEFDNIACEWSITPSSSALLQPTDFSYLGAFRLDPAANEQQCCDYSRGVGAWYPDGDGGGPPDGFPGSLFCVSFDAGGAVSQFITEYEIIEPVFSNTYSALPEASILNGPEDVVSLTGFAAMADVELLPFGGGAYRGFAASWSWTEHNVTTARHFAFTSTTEDNPLEGTIETEGYWFAGNGGQDCWSSTDPNGPYDLTDFGHTSTNTYNLTIPTEWAALHTPGKVLGVGRHRESEAGNCSSAGLTLIAVDPWDGALGTEPAAGSILPAESLIHYGDIDDPDSLFMDWHIPAHDWTGAAWVTGTKQAVIFFGQMADTIPSNAQWYGWRVGSWPNITRVIAKDDCSICDSGQQQNYCENNFDQWPPHPDNPNIPCDTCCNCCGNCGNHGGTCGDTCVPGDCTGTPGGCCYDQTPICATNCLSGGNRGYNADKWGAWIAFYDPDELALVADGVEGWNQWTIQPYAYLEISEDMIRHKDPLFAGLDVNDQPNLGAIAYDSENRLLYVTEDANSRGPIVHVYHLDD